MLYEGLITFNDPCIKNVTYDPIAPAIALAGAYVTFMLDFIGGRHRIASVRRQMNALPVTLQRVEKSDTVGSSPETPMVSNKDQPREDPVLSAMGGAGCVDEHDAVFRAEQGWQVMLLEAGIIFHS